MIESPMEYGKRITEDTYFQGKLNHTKIRYIEQQKVEDKAQALSEIMKTLDLITNRQTHEIIIKVQADHETFKIKLVTKEYLE